MRHVLEKDGDLIVCGEAVNGRDAIVKAQELLPDLVILDFSMPVMNGLEVARTLKRTRPCLPAVSYTHLTLPTILLV